MIRQVYKRLRAIALQSHCYDGAAMACRASAGLRTGPVRRSLKRTAVYWLGGGLLCLQAGCGYKGPLYLPHNPPPAQSGQTAPAAAKPAPATSNPVQNTTQNPEAAKP